MLVHYLNVPYPDDNKMAVITPSLALWGDKKEWTKEELVSQLKPMCKCRKFIIQPLAKHDAKSIHFLSSICSFQRRWARCHEWNRNHGKYQTNKNNQEFFHCLTIYMYACEFSDGRNSRSHRWPIDGEATCRSSGRIGQTIGMRLSRFNVCRWQIVFASNASDKCG